MSASTDWFFWAALSACFAALTAIFAKIGVQGVDADLATLLRTDQGAAIGARRLGLARGSVRVVPYDDRWPTLFYAEAARLRLHLGTLARGIEHFGSTAVQGFAALGRPALTFTFEPLAREHLPMLHEWLHRPHVRQWWREPSTIAELEREYVLPSADSSTHAYIAMRDDRPVGFIQSYVVIGSGGGWWTSETDPGARGIDQFLANAGGLGQGLGRAMVRAFIDRLFEDPRVTTVQTDPAPDNERAIRSYRGAGFAIVGDVDTPDGPATLMRIERAAR